MDLFGIPYLPKNLCGSETLIQITNINKLVKQNNKEPEVRGP